MPRCALLLSVVGAYNSGYEVCPSARGSPKLLRFAPQLLISANVRRSLGWITYRHLASSPKRIEVPQPAPEYLLTDGMYRWSRHPMYVAGITTWVGWAIYYGGLAVMAGALLFASAIAFIAVPYEERALQARFGEAYSRYRASVPRWFGLPRSR